MGFVGASFLDLEALDLFRCSMQARTDAYATGREADASLQLYWIAM